MQQVLDTEYLLSVLLTISSTLIYTSCMKGKKGARKNKKDLRFAILATDICLFTLKEHRLFVRLAKVVRPPYFPDNFGLPGGLIDPRETAEESAVRHIVNKGGITSKGIYMEQLSAFSALKRDPRGRVVAIAYLALVPWESISTEERTDGEHGTWSDVSDIPRLAYDHNEIISAGLARLRSRVGHSTIIARLMPLKFTLTELEEAYEAITGIDMDKRNFRKKILRSGVLISRGVRKGVRHRPAVLYGFVSHIVRDIFIT